MRLSAITEIPPELVALLEKQGVKTDSDFLSLTSVDILRRLPQETSTLGQIGYYKTVVARTATAVGLSARSLLDSASLISVPNDAANRCQLRSSLTPVLPALAPYTGRVIELSGHTNSRKSEFILNVALANLSKDTNMTVYWVDTMGEMLTEQAYRITARSDAQACLERIRWSLVLEVEQIYDILDEVAAFAKVNEGTLPSIGYLIINKITSLLGPHLTSSSFQGHVLMSELMRNLKAIAKAHSITIFVINDSTSRIIPHDTEKPVKTPALGSAFTFLTDATIWVSVISQEQLSPVSDSADQERHRVEILKSNFMATNMRGTFNLESGLHLLQA